MKRGLTLETNEICTVLISYHLIKPSGLSLNLNFLFNPFTPRALHLLKKKIQKFRADVLRQRQVEGEGRPETSLFSSKFHALSNGSYESSENRFVPEI